MSTDFRKMMDQLNRDPKVLQLKQYRQHAHTTTYAHCNHVAEWSYRLARFFRLKVDEKSLARGTMLHDYYLYDTSTMTYSAYRHGTRHPAEALKKAGTEFRLNPTERDIIRNHMWPLTLLHRPRSRESWLVCAADKICAVEEFLGYDWCRKREKQEKRKNQKLHGQKMLKMRRQKK